jgi:hypothetical protein
MVLEVPGMEIGTSDNNVRWLRRVRPRNRNARAPTEVDEVLYVPKKPLEYCLMRGRLMLRK